jgi:hypothetical protein
MLLSDALRVVNHHIDYSTIAIVNRLQFVYPYSVEELTEAVRVIKPLLPILKKDALSPLARILVETWEV